MIGPSLIEHPRVAIHACTAADLAAELAARREGVDLLLADTPYSERTHKGHNGLLPDGRKRIRYKHWTPAQVDAFCDAWLPVTFGWAVSITDHVLAPVWGAAMRRHGRYVFDAPPVPMVVTGSRVRLRGDGPSTWTYQVVLSRPTGFDWRTTRGAYYGPRERLLMTGGKPLWAMRQVVQDYSRPGDVVCDPVCGSGTSLVGALVEGRSALGCDELMVAAGLAEERVAAYLAAGRDELGGPDDDAVEEASRRRDADGA